MDSSQAISLLSLSLALAWASGINVYATILMLGILGSTGSLSLPPKLMVLTHPAVIAAAGFMYLVEFFADKIPGVDSGWDALHTFIRIPAGAILAAAIFGEMNPAIVFSAAIIGGILSAGSHATKAGSRLMINTSPEPFTNWTASVFEDVLVIAGIWMAIQHPFLFLLFLAGFIALIIYLLPRLWRGIKRLFTSIARFFGKNGAHTV
ncbi:MAG: DUF4126 domain-containing protein [Syntrophobacteraceae bacterium]